MYNYDRRATSEGTDRSTHATVVEYAVRELFKRKNPAAAAKITVAKLSGTENMFLGAGVTLVDPKKLEDALYDRMVESVIKGLSKVKEGMGHFALDGIVLDQFKQSKAVREKVKKLVQKELGKDPFPDDKS